MKSILFFDTEIDPRSKALLDIGAITSDGQVIHTSNIKRLAILIRGIDYICGHNIIKHDLKYISPLIKRDIKNVKAIDTLYLSPLLFPTKPYHRLLKDDKLQTEELNNPVNDSIKARDLFYDEISAFNEFDQPFQQVLCQLLQGESEFKHFFGYLDYEVKDDCNVSSLIEEYFKTKICSNVNINKLVHDFPIELAYCLSLINSKNRYSITPPWVLKSFPEVESIMYRLRNKPCLTGCDYCDESLDANNGLKEFFGFDTYRKFGGKPLQENAVNAAVENKSLLAVFPTGGGKSLTFQIPALMAGRNVRGLSVIISPLQSLMKDQVDNLEKNGITDAVTINGLLDPIERSKSFERVQDGSASILYISPESLRSRTIERLLLGRNVVRFIIDEAHCFSSWGQDFRVDYLYIGPFIKRLQKTKNSTEPIQVSCFTATAKQKVIEDICQYFKDNLSLNLEVFSANTSRTNLNYKVFENKDEVDKYNNLRRLIATKDCPTIIYTARTTKAELIAKHLRHDGYDAKPYHGKMAIPEKTKNQDDFIARDIKIMVATSAFGMGVDKKDVGMVIHYDISDSLENYVQEAGRAGRNEELSADCFVLFNEDDLSKHFILLNQTKLSVKEIQQIWRAIKYITKYRSTVSNSALEIARQAGWDDSVRDIETRVKTAISALEQAGYLKRGQNIPQIFANSILSKNAQAAIDKINTSKLFNDKQKVDAIRIIKKLFSSKSTKDKNEAQIDYISDHLGIVKEEVISVITLLREAKILADAKDLTTFINVSDQLNSSLSIVESHIKIEQFLLSRIKETEEVYNIKELNEAALENGCVKVNPHKIKTIFNFWAIKHWIKRHSHQNTKNHISIICQNQKSVLKEKQIRRHELSIFVVKYLFGKISSAQGHTPTEPEIMVEFSVHELKDAYESISRLFKFPVTTDDIEDTLFYLSRIGAMKIEGGFMVIYNKLTIDRLEKNNQIQYKKEDYKQLDQFYKNKVQQIHVVGEYAKKMLEDYEGALRFVEDYFQLNYSSFLKKYFPGSRREEIQKNITPKKFKQLFGTLSPRQLQIIKDNTSEKILVAAGPGSGKTRVLVHKLASLLLMEEVKHEQLLMLTFSRAATTEFKKRLIQLIGNAAHYIEIKTFHSYCFDLLGKVGDLDKSGIIIPETIKRINNGEVEINKITKTVLVIDEAQDMDIHEFGLIKVLMEKNEDMRVIAVGDDDQNIYTFRGADSKYFEQFVYEKNATKYELIENYRSKKNLVEFTNQFASSISKRFKSTPIVAVQQNEGNIKLIQYKSDQLVSPVVNDIISTEINGTTAVLTKTNEEALQIIGLLLRHQIPAKLIQSNDGFSMFNMVELRIFIDEINKDDNPTISKKTWNNAKKSFVAVYKNSTNFEICKALIKDFQTIYTKIKYQSDFISYVKESRLEDFSFESVDMINVSTIHKAKGKEFDNVFLMLNNFDSKPDNNKRQLYVAMTRAKQNLTIHYNGSHFSSVETSLITCKRDKQNYKSPNLLVFQLSHKDINLGYFKYVQHRLNTLICGNNLLVTKQGLLNEQQELILKFSKKFLDTIQKLASNGHHLASAKVKYILYWEKKEELGNVDSEEEMKIVLPELNFEMK